MKQPNAIIKYALDATVKLVNNNTAPTEALQKVAEKLDLSPDYIQRVGEALNVALHHHHFKTAQDRASDFPIADIPLVKKALFGEEEKTNIKKKAEYFSNSFDAAPANYNKILKDKDYQSNYVKIRKTAEANTPEISLTSLKGMVKRCADHLHGLQKGIDDLKTKRAGLTPQLEATYKTLVRELNKDAGARIPFEEVESQVFANHGEEAVPYLDFVYKTAGLKEERGVHDDKYQFFTDSKATQLFGNLLKISKDILETEEKIKSAELNYKQQYELYKEACAIMAGNQRTAEYKIAEDLDPVQTYIRNKAEKQAALKKEKMEKAAAPGTMLGSIWDKFKDMQNKAEPPTPVFQNTENDNNERKHILQELIMTDPLLVHQDPKKIIGAYEQMLRIAPHLAKQKDVVRAHLRAATTGGHHSMSSFDAAQHMDANMKLMNQYKMLINDQRGMLPKSDK